MAAGSPVDKYLARFGPAPYHVCYECDDIEAEIERLRKKRFKVIAPPASAVAFGGRRVAFVYSLSIGLIEFVESESTGTEQVQKSFTHKGMDQ